MTEREAKEMLEAYMECDRRKNEVAYDYQCDKDCESCELNYEQGTVGEHKEAVNMAINALEKQDKIKEAFTHYDFNGHEGKVIRDCIDLLSEIKRIVKE